MRNMICPNCKGSFREPCDRCDGYGDTRQWIEKAELPPEEVTMCIWCRGEGIQSCKTCNGSGLVHPPEPQRTTDKWVLHNAWIKTIREVAATQNQKLPPTKRFVTALEKAINDPCVQISWNPDRFGYYEIAMWINVLGRNDYDERLDISWSKGGDRRDSFDALQTATHPSWANLEENLIREDTTDYLDRIKQEKSIAPELVAIDDMIANLKKQIVALRNTADHILVELPKPESAILRVNRVHWDQPTIYARTLYPAIWPPSK